MKQDYFSLLNKRNAQNSAELLNFTTVHDDIYASKFNNPDRRRDTITSRNLARLLLSSITKKPFKTWRFIVNTNQARMATTDDISTYHVSFSHSPNWLAVAVSELPIGIDIEETKKSRPWQNMIDFLDLPCPNLKIENEIDFLKYWTHSEALFKFRSAASKTAAMNSYPYCPRPDTLVSMVTSSTDYPIQKNGAHLIERHFSKIET